MIQRRLQKAMLFGTPLCLLTLLLIGFVWSRIEHARAPQDWDFSGLIFALFLAPVFWSLPILGLLHALAAVWWQPRRLWLGLGALYLGLFGALYIVIFR